MPWAWYLMITHMCRIQIEHANIQMHLIKTCILAFDFLNLIRIRMFCILVISCFARHKQEMAPYNDYGARFLVVSILLVTLATGFNTCSQVIYSCILACSASSASIIQIVSESNKLSVSFIPEITHQDSSRKTPWSTKVHRGVSQHSLRHSVTLEADERVK